MDKLKEYYAGDEIASSVWLGKYALKTKKGDVKEETPTDMHRRMAKEFARVDAAYPRPTPEQKKQLSDFGANLTDLSFDEHFIFSYFYNYKHIIPQGSVMSGLGSDFIVSLSNCLRLPPPDDSYGSIMFTDNQLVNAAKRRCGYGLGLSKIRPRGARVNNAASSSTGAASFMNRYSNSTREVAQEGRRGACLEDIDVMHPDSMEFAEKKIDRTQVTGANISVKIYNDFMEALDNNADYLLRYPTDLVVDVEEPSFKQWWETAEYEVLWEYQPNVYLKKVSAKKYWDRFIELARDNAEPGLFYWDRMINYDPTSVYRELKPDGTNACGEQPMAVGDTCRLITQNLFSLVRNPYTPEAYLDFEKLYEVSYIQQRLGDDLVDLEIEYATRILNKVKADPQPEHVKLPEMMLWQSVIEKAQQGRRTGGGITGLADMLAALNLKYDSDEALEVVEAVMRKKMEAELDCTIDLAILRGPFQVWDKALEFPNEGGSLEDVGGNDFYTMMLSEFPQQAFRMMRSGRRNSNWSTIAPTGTTSLVAKLIKYCNLSSGCEPQFAVLLFRNRKINPSDKGARVDFKDQNGDCWQTYPIVMGGFREWYDVYTGGSVPMETLTKEQVEACYKLSPYYGSCANDINWKKRVEMQGILQKYTTSAISSTLNLPETVTKEEVDVIYREGYKHGLKGVTIYRDNCRTGVLVTEQKKEDSFSYKDAVKRPKDLEGDLSIVRVKGERYGVIVGFLEGKPYEIFAFNLPDEVSKECQGIITKVKKGHYDFTCPSFTFQNIQDAALHSDENVLTRLLSAMLRHGIKPQFVMEQIEKTQLEVVSFGKAVSRILKKYVAEKDLLQRAKCKSCGSTNLAMQEGCLSCKDCGESKCG